MGIENLHITYGEGKSKKKKQCNNRRRQPRHWINWIYLRDDPLEIFF